MKRMIQLITIASFLGYLSFMGYQTLNKEPVEYSELEYRMLSLQPEFSTDLLVSGEYMKDFESYFQDQFYNRIEMSKNFYHYQMALGKPVVSTVLLGDNDWAKGIPPERTSEKLIKQTIRQTKKLNDFAAEQNIPLYLSVNPHKDYAMSGLFLAHPNTEVALEQKERILAGLDSDISVIDNSAYFQETFEQEELEKLYYKTDHHWNYLGAYEGYKHLVTQLHTNHPEIPEALEQEDLLLISADREKTSFLGSTNRVLLNILDESEEPVCAYSVKDSSVFSEAYYIDRLGNRVDGMDKLFHTTLNNEEQTYGGLTTGDYGLMVLKMKEAPNDRNVLIIKDSYNNAMMPYLGLHFAETHVMDMRYYQDGSAMDYITDNDINFVILAHNDQLVGDTFRYDGKED